jgi:hypothetical protein
MYWRGSYRTNDTRALDDVRIRIYGLYTASSSPAPRQGGGFDQVRSSYGHGMERIQLNARTLTNTHLGGHFHAFKAFFA